MRVLLFIFLFTHLFSQAQVKDRYNYVQRPSHNSVTIAWRTQNPGTSVIKYGLSPSELYDSLVSKNSVRKHYFDIKGLDPNTKYYYQTETKEEIS